MANRLSAHIGYLFTELPFSQRASAASAAGFTAIEHPQPFAIPATEMMLDLKRHDLVFSQVAAAVGDAAKGEKGLAALPGREADFREGFDQALDYALAVDCPLIHPMAGVPDDAHLNAAKETYLRNIDYAVEKTMRLPLKVLIEPISHSAVPGYALSAVEEAVTVQDIFGPGNVCILVDTFHAAANGFDLPPWISGNSYRIGHVHVADHPGRHEPGTGKIDFEPILAALSEEGYDGAIGFEYIPSTTTAESLGFLPKWKRPTVARSRTTAGD